MSDMRREYNAFAASVADEVEALRATQATAIAQQMALDEESLSGSRPRRTAARCAHASCTCDLHAVPTVSCVHGQVVRTASVFHHLRLHAVPSCSPIDLRSKEVTQGG